MDNVLLRLHILEHSSNDFIIWLANKAESELISGNITVQWCTGIAKALEASEHQELMRN